MRLSWNKSEGDVMPRVLETKRRPSKDYAIHSVDKAFDLLEAMCERGGELRIAELSQRLDLDKTNVFRLLSTFENRGYVERVDGSGGYRLGLPAYAMAQKLLSHMGLLRKARPAMARLARQSGEAVYFMAPRMGEVLLLDAVDSSHQVKVVSLVGQCFALGTSAAGQVFRVFAPNNEHVQVNKAQLVMTLPEENRARIRQNGYCHNENGIDEGVSLLSAPLFNAEGEVVAALALLGPSYRMPRERIDNDLAPQLLETARGISTSLGYYKDYMLRIAS